MPNAPAPSTVRQGLADAANALQGVSPNVGFGSRQPRPTEEPNKPGQWSGYSQLTSLTVKWDDTFIVGFGDKRENNKTVPAASLQATFVTTLNGKPYSWSTRTYRWVYGDPEVVVPLLPDGTFRERFQVEAKKQQSIVMGWFRNILGTSGDDPILRHPEDVIPIIDNMLAQAAQTNQPVIVKAGWVKTVDTYTIKKGDRKGQQGSREEANDFIYEGGTTENPQDSGGQPA